MVSDLGRRMDRRCCRRQRVASASVCTTCLCVCRSTDTAVTVELSQQGMLEPLDS